jgi:hypothetical protein
VHVTTLQRYDPQNSQSTSVVLAIWPPIIQQAGRRRPRRFEIKEKERTRKKLRVRVRSSSLPRLQSELERGSKVVLEARVNRPLGASFAPLWRDRKANVLGGKGDNKGVGVGGLVTRQSVGGNNAAGSKEIHAKNDRKMTWRHYVWRDRIGNESAAGTSFRSFQLRFVE